MELILTAVIGAVISGALLVFIVKRVTGRRWPHRVTLADYWWIHSAGKLVTEKDPAGPSDEYTTRVRIQVRGRRLEGTRNLTNVTLNEKARFWRFWKWGRWAAGPTSLDLVGDAMTKVREEGMTLGDSDSPAMECTVVEDGRQGRYSLSGRWRVVPWAGKRHGVSKRLKRSRLDT